VAARVNSGFSGGSLYVWGVGGSNCTYTANQTVKVTLYKNGVWQTSKTFSGYTGVLTGSTAAIWARYTPGNCTTYYQAATTHYVNGYQSTSWSGLFYAC